MASRKKGGTKHLGRPLLPRDELRKHRVVVHLTDEEMQRLTAVANEHDADLGAAARKLLSDALKHRR